MQRLRLFGPSDRTTVSDPKADSSHEGSGCLTFLRPHGGLRNVYSAEITVYLYRHVFCFFFHPESQRKSLRDGRHKRNAFLRTSKVCSLSSGKTQLRGTCARNSVTNGTRKVQGGQANIHGHHP